MPNRAQAANQNRAAAISGGYRRQGEALQEGYQQAQQQSGADSGIRPTFPLVWSGSHYSCDLGSHY